MNLLMTPIAALILLRQLAVHYIHYAYAAWHGTQMIRNQIKQVLSVSGSFFSRINARENNTPQTYCKKACVARKCK